MTTSTPDVLVLGGGPAGISAALWAARLGVTPLLLEGGPRLGGQLLRSYHRSVDCPGFYGLTGAEIADRLTEHLVAESVPFRVNARVTEFSTATLTATVGDEHLTARAIILALGVEKRRLGIPGEREFAGRGVSTSATRDNHLYKKKDVVIVGGGDGAFEEALMLDDAGCRVTLIHRSDRFRARPRYRDAVFARPGIRVLTHACPTEILGDEAVRAIRLEIAPPGEAPKTVTLDVSGVFLTLGISPATALVAGQLDRDAEGFIVTDRHGATSRPGVWACGEATHPLLPSITTAFGDGATAAKAVFEQSVVSSQ
jgi:thioredoxin reductase (NADPH)